jgi:hypothetical protein
MQNSTQLKKTGRGGARANAGRKPKPAKHVKAPTECVATAILEKVGIQQRIETLLTITDPTNKEMRTRFAASPTLYMRSIEQHWEILEGLMNRAWGKAKQAVEHSGDVNHHHSFESLSDADLNKEIGKLREFSEGGESSPGATARGEGEAARA